MPEAAVNTSEKWFSQASTQTDEPYISDSEELVPTRVRRFASRNKRQVFRMDEPTPIAPVKMVRPSFSYAAAAGLR